MTDVDTVRLLTADTGSPQALTDPQLQTLLDLEDGSIRLAAAQALDIIASSEVLVSKVITSNGLTTNGAAVAKSLMDRAASLRLQEETTGDGGGYFEFITPDDDDGFFEVDDEDDD